MQKDTEVLEFIFRRFPHDKVSIDNYINKNCYYFSIILKERFPDGEIYYDVISGHFIFKYEEEYYDFTGIYTQKGKFIKWDDFDQYDSLQKQRIILGSIK